VQRALLAEALLRPNASHAVGLVEAKSRRFALLVVDKLKICFPALASLAQGRKAPGALSRQIVSLFSPDTLDLLNLPGSATTAGRAPAGDGAL
jgi:hypothetical protein